MTTMSQLRAFLDAASDYDRVVRLLNEAVIAAKNAKASEADAYNNLQAVCSDLGITVPDRPAEVTDDSNSVVTPVKGAK